MRDARGAAPIFYLNPLSLSLLSQLSFKHDRVPWGESRLVTRTTVTLITASPKICIYIYFNSN